MYFQYFVIKYSHPCFNYLKMTLEYRWTKINLHFYTESRLNYWNYMTLSHLTLFIWMIRDVDMNPTTCIMRGCFSDSLSQAETSIYKKWQPFIYHLYCYEMSWKEHRSYSTNKWRETRTIGEKEIIASSLFFSSLKCIDKYRQHWMEKIESCRVLETILVWMSEDKLCSFQRLHSCQLEVSTISPFKNPLIHPDNIHIYGAKGLKLKQDLSKNSFKLLSIYFVC